MDSSRELHTSFQGLAEGYIRAEGKKIYPLNLKKVKEEAEERKEGSKEGEKEGGRVVRRGSSRRPCLLKRSKISSLLHSVIRALAHRLPSILSFSTVEERSGGGRGSPPPLSQWSSTERR